MAHEVVRSLLAVGEGGDNFPGFGGKCFAFVKYSQTARERKGICRKIHPDAHGSHEDVHPVGRNALHNTPYPDIKTPKKMSTL